MSQGELDVFTRASFSFADAAGMSQDTPLALGLKTRGEGPEKRTSQAEEMVDDYRAAIKASGARRYMKVDKRTFDQVLQYRSQMVDARFTLQVLQELLQSRATTGLSIDSKNDSQAGGVHVDLMLRSFLAVSKIIGVDPPGLGPDGAPVSALDEVSEASAGARSPADAEADAKHVAAADAYRQYL